MPRRRRISLEQRERLVKAFEDEHEDYLAVTDTIGVNIVIIITFISPRIYKSSCTANFSEKNK